MKNLLLRVIKLFLITQTAVSAQQFGIEWYKLQSPINNTLYHLTFVDNLTGWAAGEAGTIIHTTDGGNTWIRQNSNVQTDITEIFFLNQNLGWALTYKLDPSFRSTFLKTSDGGENWYDEDFPDTTRYIQTIFFFDSLNGFIGGWGSGSYIAYTSDGGNEWIQADLDTGAVSPYPIRKLSFYNRQFGYACGGRHDIGGAIYRTIDYGLTWSQVSWLDEISDLFIFDSLNAITLSCDLDGFTPLLNNKTSDAGVSWTYEWLNVDASTLAMDFRTPNEGWSASGEIFLFTSDGGEAWIEKETPDSSIIYDLQFLNSQTGYACGGEGVILKYGSPPVNVIEEIKPVSGFDLYQNYPNPFNPSTKITYSISHKAFVSLQVYDQLGSEVAELVREEKEAGRYEIEVNASDLSSGVYFYKIQAGDFVETKKMILLR